jgi:hypothetical protein
MFLRRRNGWLYLAANDRLGGRAGVHRQTYIGCVTPDIIEAVRVVIDIKQARRDRQKAIRDSVGDVDNRLADQWRIIWKSLNRELGKRGYRHVRCQWRRKRSFAKAR